MISVEKKITYFITFCFLFFFVSALMIVVDGLRDDIGQSDAIVILGNKVDLDGTPSKRLQARLDGGYEIYKNGVAPLVIVTGGFGKEGYDEAVVMKEYLVKKGVPEESIIVDSEGVNTTASAKNSRNIFRESGSDSVIVVSSYYHISRTRLAFKRAGFTSVFSSHGILRFEMRDLYSIPREVIGFYYYLIRG